ncbi:MAG TPA: ATP synthase subunit I [Paracoccus sp.]|nr:ATP synthase subunit I [Paracoccus sp. (in: a-proteobacteria)]
MSGALALFLAAGAGTVLGLFYYGGLWLTVRQLERTRRPALLFGASLILRLSLTVLGFYTVMGGGWQRALACLAGFVIARRLLTALAEPAPVVAQSKERAGS